MALALNYFATASGRSPPLGFLSTLPMIQRAHIVADVEAYRIHMTKAPISVKSIKGRRPMFEIRTGAFRTYCVVRSQTLWVLHIGRKQDQRRDIGVAAERMRAVHQGG